MAEKWVHFIERSWSNREPEQYLPQNRGKCPRREALSPLPGGQKPGREKTMTPRKQGQFIQTVEERRMLEEGNDGTDEGWRGLILTRPPSGAAEWTLLSREPGPSEEATLGLED